MVDGKIVVYVKSVKTKKVMKVDIPKRPDDLSIRGNIPPKAKGSIRWEGRTAIEARVYSHQWFDKSDEELVEDEYVLPPDQTDAIDLVKNVAARYGYEVEIVDLGKENILMREIKEKIKGIDTIPTVETSLGGKLKGSQINKKSIEALLRKEMHAH